MKAKKNNGQVNRITFDAANLVSDIDEVAIEIKEPSETKKNTSRAIRKLLVLGLAAYRNERSASNR